MKIFVLFALLFTSVGFAADNLVLDNQTYKEGKTKLITKLSYHNTHKLSPTQDYILLDVGNGKSIPVTTHLGETATNSDTLLASVGADYGINDRLGVGMAMEGVYHTTRNDILGTNHNKTLTSFSLNAQYQLTDSTLLYTDFTAYDKSADLRPKALSDVVVGINAHTINDPIVISGQLGYQYRTPRQTKAGKMIDFGDSIFASSTVGFSVNPEITLTTGVSWSYHFANRANGRALGIDQTNTNLSAGLAYALSARTNITANIRTNISGQGGSTIALSFHKKLGSLAPSLSDRYKQLNKLQPPADTTVLSPVSTP